MEEVALEVTEEEETAAGGAGTGGREEEEEEGSGCEALAATDLEGDEEEGDVEMEVGGSGGVNEEEGARREEKVMLEVEEGSRGSGAAEEEAASGSDAGGKAEDVEAEGPGAGLGEVWFWAVVWFWLLRE